MTRGPAAPAARARAIAFYLPQFHPIPENDQWWGTGFTEWTNVVQAQPRFSGHYQPHLPADLGFYDLRLPEVRAAQAALAQRAGIEGFCYYHYWFHGRRLLNRPIDDVLASGEPDFPFCLCWANQSWSRTWSGRDHELLIEQTYSDADDARHIAWLLEVFADRRYIKVDGRPLFLVYLPESLPNPAGLLANWRAASRQRGAAEPFFCAVRTGFCALTTQGLRELGFDGVVEFEPNRAHFPVPRNVTGKAVDSLRRLLPAPWYDALRDNRWLSARSLNTIVDYARYVEAQLQRPRLDERTFPVVFPSWDNSARRTSATIIENHEASRYLEWLRDAVQRVESRPDSQRLVFINAWNEWAEGCHLEPDRRHGSDFLDATALALLTGGEHG